MPVYESRGKIYNIPDNKVSDFLSRRNDAKIVEETPSATPAKTLDLSQIEGETTAAAGVAPLNAAQKQKGFWKTQAGDALENLGGGALSLLGGIALARDHFDITSPRNVAWLLDKATGANVAPQKGSEGKQLIEKGNEILERGGKYGNIIDPETGQIRKKTFRDLHKEGDYLGALNEIFLTATQSVPTSLAAMAPGGLAIVGISAAGQKYNELDSDPETKDMPEWKKWLNAAASGALESVTEKVGAKVDAKMIAPFLEKMTEKTVKQILAKGGVNSLVQTVTEGLEEVLSQSGENLVDYATGVTEEYDPMRGLADSFIYGAGGGAQFGGVTLGLSGVRAGQTARNNARINKEYNKAGINLDKQLPGESRELKDYIDKTLSSGDESTITSLINNTLVDGELTVDQKKSIIEYALASDARQQKNTDKKTRSDTAARNIIKEVDSNLNETSGTLMTVTLGTGINATQVQVIKGIVPNEDGTINRELSESEFYYRDENGETQVAPIEMAGNVTENIPRDEAVKQIATPVIESIVADEENENALASQDFQPGDMVYYIDPASGMAAGIQLQGISENGKYIGINDSGAQQEVEPRLVQSEQDFLSSMRDEEIETAIDNLNQSLTSGALNGNLSDRMIDLRSKLETELQQRSQKSSKTLNTSPSQQPPSRDLQQTGRDILSELNRISSDIHSTAGNAIIDGTWDGDFRGAGTSTLEIDNEGNVVLRRGASDMQHLIKEGESVSGRQELYDTSLTNGGGKGVPTASNSQVGDGYTYSDREITGIFRIPINDFLELARKGEIILGNTGEQEIVISPSVAKKYLSETKSKTETEAQEAQTEATPEDLIRQMEENALEAPQLELTPENWEAEFGEDGKVKTPVGEVKMGDNQYRKIIKAGRQKEFGMIKPTLTNPDVVIEVPSEAIEGQTTERPSSYLFVKTFKYGEERIKFFTSVTVSKDGLEVVVSNHIENLPRMRGFIRNGKLLYQRPDMVPGAEASSPASTGQSTEADNTAGTSVDKDNTENPQMQANAPENSQTEPKPDPFINFPRNKKGEIDVENLTAEQQLQYAESAAGEQFAIEQAARSIRGLEKKRASLEEKLERETNMAKAANIQKEIENINKSIGFYKEYREARNQQNDLAARQQAFEESKTNSNTPESTADTPPADTPTPFHQTTEKPNPIPETKLKPLIERLKQTGLAKEVITDKARMREYLEKYFGKEGAERLMRALNGSVKNKDRKILRTDENGRQIAWENDSYFISLSHGDKQHYSVALWDKSNGAKVGELYGTLDNKDVPKGYISVENVKIDARHRGQGLSVEMYQALIDFSDEDVKGISSYLPDRINKVQVPRIWKKFGGMTEGDYDNIRFMSTPKGEVYGFVTPEGEIYLDPDKMNANTPIHEFGHLWNSFVEKNNPELWEKGIELAKQSDLFVRAKNNPASFGLKENATDREIADEVLARLYGNRGESTFHEKGLGEKLQAWLNEVLEWIGSKLGIRNLTPDQIQNLTLEQFVDGATADILSGKPIPIPQSPKSLETSKTSDTRYQFTGEKGAANLDKTEEATTRMDNLDVAREMETAGKEAKAIKFATGWERGADGKWRYEIPDFKVSDIKTWGDGNFVGQLEDLVADADFLKAYPELKGVKVNVLDLDFWDRQDEVSNGEYDPRKKEITVKYHKNDPNSAGIMHEILVHEIQHAVQNQEGFAKGSSPISFKDNLSEIVNRIEEITGVKLSGRVEDFERELSKYEGDNRLAAPIAVHGKELDELAIKYGYADRFGLFENLENESSLAKYHKTAGEVESRNASRRRNMTPEERRSSLAAETEDVAREDQIFLYDGLGGRSPADKNLYNSRKNDIFAENNNENGTEISERLPQGTDGGGVETSTNMERTTQDNQSGESSAGYVRQAAVGAGSKAEQLDVIEKTAKEKGIWIDSPSSLGDYFSEGGENEVYFNPPGNKVYKVNNFEYAGDDVLNFFDRIDAHNELFGNVPYKITGFTRNRKGEVSAILEQPYVEAEREATEDEIVSYMGSLGFEANGIDDFSNGKYNVFDAVPNNVLVGKDGRLYFIDTIINHSRNLESRENESSARENESVVREPAIDTQLNRKPDTDAVSNMPEGEGLLNENTFSDGRVDVLALAANVVKQNEVREAESEVNTSPTEGQKEAGNYKKGHVQINGFNVSIEQPKGSTRSGTDPDGNAWEQTMHNTYGYIRGTESRDGDQIDVFLGDNPNSGKIFVIDQVNTETLGFDEHKVMMGFDTIEQAREAYLSNYEDGWTGLGDIAETDIETFKKWAGSEGRRIKPFSEYGKSGVRFQLDVEGNGDVGVNREVVRQEIDRKVHGIFNKFREGWEDMHLPVRIFFDELRKLGVKISSMNDFYQNVTAVAGKNDFELRSFHSNQGKKMLDSVFALMDAGKSYRDIINYVFLKHGPERNEYMRKQAVEEYRQKETAKIPAAISAWKASHPKATQAEIDAQTAAEQSLVESRVLKKADAIKDKDYAGVKAVEEEVGVSAQEYTDSFERDVSPEGSKVMEDFWKNMRSATGFSLDKLVAGGVLSKESADEMKKRWQHYVPLQGHDEKTAEDVYDYLSVMGTYFTSPLKKAHGRTSRADDPFAYIYQMAQSSISTSNINLLKQGLKRIATHQDTKGLMSADNTWYMNTGQTDENGRAVWEPQYPLYSPDSEQFEKNIQDFNERMNELAAQGMARQSNAKFDIGGLFIKRTQKMEHAVSVFENGKEYTVYINAAPDIARAINSENRVIPHPIIAKTGELTRWMAANMTSRNPAFIATNFTRDITQAFSMLPVKEGAAYTAEFAKNIPHSAASLSKYLAGKGDPSGNKYDKYAYEFFANGGKTGFTHILELGKTKKEISRELKKLGHPNVWTSTVSATEGILAGLQIGNDFAENLSRLSAYITSREAGRDVHRSISDAKEVTVNFNRKGSGGAGAAIFRPLYLFLNAGIQGLSNFARVAVKHPKAMSAMLSAYAFSGVSQGLLMSLLGDDREDEYWRLPDHIRRSNLILPGINGFIMIPLPQELRVFHGLGDVALMAMTGRKDISSSLIDAIEVLSDSLPLNPMGAQKAGVVNTISPDILKPALQAYGNRSWIGAPIYNEWAKEEDPGYKKVRTNKKGEPYTPEWLINSLQGIDHATGGDGTERGAISLNPDKVNHYAKGYFGGLYTLAAQSADIAMKVSGSGGDIKTKDIPFLNRFYQHPDDLRVLPGYVEDNYRAASDKVNDAKRKLKDYEKRSLNPEEKMDPSKLKQKIKENGRIVDLFDKSLREIEKAESGLKEFSGEEQKVEERRIAEMKIRWLNEFSKETKKPKD